MIEQSTEQPTAASAPPTALSMLTTAIGLTIGCHISQCRAGGYVVTIDGAIHSARSSLIEAVAVVGQVASEQYGEPAQPAQIVPPEAPARDLRDEPLRPIGLMEGADGERLTEGGPRVVGVPELQPVPRDLAPDFARKIRSMAEMILVALVVGLSAIMRV